MARAWSNNRTGRAPTRVPAPRGPSAGTGTRTGSNGVVGHALHDHAVHFIPWVVLVLFWVAGTALHAFVETAWSRAGTVAMILVATAGIVFSVWQTNRTHTGTARWHGIVSAGFGGAWLSLCTITGFITIDTTTAGWAFGVHGFTIATFGVGGAALAAVWNGRIHARHRAAELADLLAAQNPPDTPMKMAGHDGAVMQLRRVSAYRSEGVLRLSPGDTLQDFQKDLRSVESAHGLPPGSMTVHARANSRNAQICDVTVMHDNPIADAQPWPGLLVGAK